MTYTIKTSRLLLAITLALTLALSTVSGTPAFATGTLFAGTDTEEFNLLTPPDNLASTPTNGPVPGATTIIQTPYDVNGMTVVGSTLVTGNPLTNILNIVDFLGNVITGGIVAQIPNFCCNEDMAYDGVSVWHASFGANTIEELDPNNLAGAPLSVCPMNFGPVGMTDVNGQLWTTDWGAGTVGTFNPAGCTYNAVFTVSPLSVSGGLAYDPTSATLWVGSGGGLVAPYDLLGNSLGPGFQPFGAISDTVDGLAFAPDLETAGELIPVSMTSLFVAGAAANAMWIIPMIASATGLGFYLTQGRWNKIDEE